jgi:hypothetical protein
MERGDAGAPGAGLGGADRVAEAPAGERGCGGGRRGLRQVSEDGEEGGERSGRCVGGSGSCVGGSAGGSQKLSGASERWGVIFALKGLESREKIGAELGERELPDEV